MSKKPKPMNKISIGMFPLRKKHTNKTLKSDVSKLRKKGYPVKIALHTLDTNKKKQSTKTRKARGLLTVTRQKRSKKKT